MIAESTQAIVIGQCAGIGAKCLVFGGCTVDTDATRGEIVGIGNSDIETVCDGCSAAVFGRDFHGNGADIAILRRATEGARIGIKIEPGWQCAATRQLGAVGQRIARVHIAEGTRRIGKTEGYVFSGRLVRDGLIDCRVIIAVGDRDIKAVRDCRAGAVFCRDFHRDGAHITIQRRATECARIGIKIEPCG